MGSDRDVLAVGKVPSRFLASLLAEGTLPAEVRLGPAVGEDAAAIDVPAGTVVVATDPITLTSGDIGAYAVVINANDVAVTGARPTWFLASVLLPPGTTASEVEVVLRDLRTALSEIGAALVGGHTEITPAVRQPVVVGLMLGHVPTGRVCATGGARPGDVLVQVGSAPVEGAAVLAAEHEGALADLPAEVLTAARDAVSTPGISVVDAALRAAELGATSLHDPTEGGLAAGLNEMAAASGAALAVDPSAVAWFEPGRAVCDALGADAWATLASGCLLAAFPPVSAAPALVELARHGEPCAVIGTVEKGSGVDLIGQGPLVWPERDEVARLGS